MDAFLKCLLACVVSLLPTGNSSYSSHLISDAQLISRFSSERERYQDLVLDMMIANDPPNVVLLDSKESSHINMQNYSLINTEMHNLGVRSITRNGTRFAFRVDETKDSAKDLVFQAYGFVKNKSNDSDHINVSRIDDDWAVELSSKPETPPH